MDTLSPETVNALFDLIYKFVEDLMRTLGLLTSVV